MDIIFYIFINAFIIKKLIIIADQIYFIPACNHTILHIFFNENQDVKKCDHCITFKLLTFLKKET
ncbi:hypothetical protein A9325_12620 [Yersinia pestis]|nr:hypothetical protein RN24_13575 [Yersinia pestis subsp. microtus bv. Ulegeica]PVF19847.1 hypothetical protein A9325_12620 [Yersinia pestis]PVF63626.1 hypothetical protein BCY80_14570 [Yersinia pestis]